MDKLVPSFGVDPALRMDLHVQCYNFLVQTEPLIQTAIKVIPLSNFICCTHNEKHLTMDIVWKDFSKVSRSGRSSTKDGRRELRLRVYPCYTCSEQLSTHHNRYGTTYDAHLPQDLKTAKDPFESCSSENLENFTQWVENTPGANIDAKNDNGGTVLCISLEVKFSSLPLIRRHTTWQLEDCKILDKDRR